MNENLKNLDFRYHYKEIHDIYQSLLVMEGSNPLFDRVELFINEPQPVVFTRDLYRFLGEEKTAQTYQQLLEPSQSLYWHHTGNSIMLVHKIPGLAIGQVRPFGVLVVHLNEAKVLNLVQTLTPYDRGFTLLFEEHGKVLMSGGTAQYDRSIEQGLYQDILSRSDPSGTFLYYWEGETYSVTYGSFNRLGSTWIYVSAAPLTAITNPVLFFSKLIIATSLFILFLAGVVSWLASRKLYSPIEKLVCKIGASRTSEAKVKDEFALIEAQWNNLSRESQVLQKRLDQHLPYLREGFLMQLLQGYMYPFTEKELRERMENLGWEPADSQFVIIVVQLFGFSKLEGRFSEGDEGLVTFAAANIIEELCSHSTLQVDVINFHDLSIGLMVSVPAWMTRTHIEDELYRLTAEMIARIEEILKMQATIGISCMTDSIKSVPGLFEETKIALRFRNLQESSQVIDLEKLDEEERLQDVKYPFALEKEIMYAIRLGDEERAVHYIRQFIDVLTKESTDEAALKQGVLQLLGSILHVVMQSGISTRRIYEGIDLYEKLSQIREPEKIVQWFELSVIRPFMAEWSKKKDRHMRQLVEKTIILLNEQFMNDISLEYCADAIKISPYVLSKAFKNVTGLNFIDYLTNIRLERAKQMLRDSDWKISDIAEKVGYQNSYFNRLFKKHVGLTPGQYREQSKREKERISGEIR